MLDKDKEGLHAYGDEVLEGLQAAMRLVGASQGWIGIKEKYEDVIEAMRPKLTRGVEIALLPYSYPAGDECVQVGQRVTQGQVIGRPPVRHGKPALGVPVHTSIDDTVSSVRDGVAWLQRTWP